MRIGQRLTALESRQLDRSRYHVRLIVDPMAGETQRAAIAKYEQAYSVDPKRAYWFRMLI